MLKYQEDISAASPTRHAEPRQRPGYQARGVVSSTAALVALDQKELDPAVIDDTLGVMLKYQEDIQAVRGEPVRAMLNRANGYCPGYQARGVVSSIVLTCRKACHDGSTGSP